jgi:hypothetical protein
MNRTRSRAPTRVSDITNTVLLVGGSDRLAVWCDDAAAAASGAMIERCDMKTAATAATQIRPFAIVIPEDLYEFDTTELDALARDVQASLVVVSESIEREELMALLLEASRQHN